VAVSNPLDRDDSTSLIRLHNEALATSTTAVRRWHRGGRLLHHLIHPRTRLPGESGVLSASVIAPTATEADVFAKTALLLGPNAGARFLVEKNTPGLFVMDTKETWFTNNWPGTRPS
jgi:thiamine biosynthesis lipoprotein